MIEMGSFPEACRLKPYGHQVVGVRALVESLESRWRGFLLADEPGAMKTKQVIDAAQVLFEAGKIDAVIVLTIAEARPLWYDPDPAFGEIAMHTWEKTPTIVTEWHSRPRAWANGAADREGTKRWLRWYCSNYEYVRNKPKAEGLAGLAAGPRTLLVLDESAAIRNHTSAQFKTAFMIRRKCAAVWELNGTPIAQSPGDAYAQAAMIDRGLLGCQTKVDFLARYAVMGGFMAGGRKVADASKPSGFRIVGGRPTQVLKWVNIDNLQRRLAPAVLRRLKSECLDLPPKLPVHTLPVPLSKESWRIYKDMRDDAIAYLDSSSASAALAAGIKVMRLAQITSGFVGGVEDADFEQMELEDLDAERPQAPRRAVREIGEEKLQFLMWWLRSRLEENPSFRLQVWCRFRPEVDRLLGALRAESALEGAAIVGLFGGQSRDERLAVLKTLHPNSAPSGPIVSVGVIGTGATGINCASIDNVMHLSHGNSLFHRTQSDERVHRAGQRNPVAYWEVVATGPDGQRTIDHTLVKAMRARQEIADWTCSAWSASLKEERDGDAA